MVTATDFTGSSGQSNSSAVQASADIDGDGLPDLWELANGLATGNTTGNHGATGDPDGDRIPDLLEYAFHLDPCTASAKGSPFAAEKTNPADGKDYLEFTYRRRSGAPQITYTVENSPDCITWTADRASTNTLLDRSRLGTAFRIQ